MKKFALSLSLLLISSAGFGQIFVGEVDINHVDSIKIVEVYINRRALKQKVHVYVDFGQRDNINAKDLAYRSDDLEIVDPKTRKKVVFKSTAAVLNFFARNHWEYVNGFAENTPDTAGYYYYFKKSN